MTTILKFQIVNFKFGTFGIYPIIPYNPLKTKKIPIARMKKIDNWKISDMFFLENYKDYRILPLL